MDGGIRNAIVFYPRYVIPCSSCSFFVSTTCLEGFYTVQLQRTHERAKLNRYHRATCVVLEVTMLCTQYFLYYKYICFYAVRVIFHTFLTLLLLRYHHRHHDHRCEKSM